MPAPTAAEAELCSSWSTVALRTPPGGRRRRVPSCCRPMGPFQENRPRRSRRTCERYDCVGGGDRRRPPRPDRAGRLDAPVRRPSSIASPGWLSTCTQRPGAFPVRMRSTTPGQHTRPTGSITPGSWCISSTRASTTGGAHLQRVPIMVDDTRETLEARLHEVEHGLFVATIGDYLVVVSGAHRPAGLYGSPVRGPARAR